MNARPRMPPAPALAATALAAALALGGCSLPPEDSANGSHGVFPYHDRDDCGMSWKYDLAPIRAVTTTQGATDLLMALGLKNNVVATNPAVTTKDAPDFNKIRATNADFVYSGTRAGMSEDLRQALTGFDHPTHVSLLYCPTHRQTLETVYLEVTVIGDVFGVPDQAAALVSTWKRAFDQIAARVRTVARPNVAVVDARGAVVKLAGTESLAQVLLATAGGANVAVGAGEWVDSDWAKVKAARPDYVFLLAGSKPPADPVLAQKVKHVDELNDGFFEAGPQVLALAQLLAKTLHPDKL